MLDELSLINLGRCVLCSFALLAASGYTLPVASPHQAVTWAALVVALAGVYYVLFWFWRACPLTPARTRSAEMTGINPNPLHPLAETAYTTVEESLDHPHLTTTSVYIYVYGWGVLLFVSLYCMAGLHTPSSCWWAVGMLMLSFDELVSREAPRLYVTVLSTLLWTSASALWWASSGSLAREESAGAVLISVVIPVLSPFIFFSLRSIRMVCKDTRALCEVALPFMILISVGVLVNSDYTALLSSDSSISYDQLAFSQSHDRRRHLNPNGTELPHARQRNLTYLETPSYFNPNGTELPLPTLPVAYVRINKYLVLLGVPLLACASILNLAMCVLRGFVTEFICSFLLTLSVKHIALHPGAGWSAQVALGAAGGCFIALVMLRRSL
jgi:hypothetical protein